MQTRAREWGSASRRVSFAGDRFTQLCARAEPLTFSYVMPAFQNPVNSSSSKRKTERHDLNDTHRKRQATEESGVSAMEGDHYWMVQWWVLAYVEVSFVVKVLLHFKA